MYLPFMNPVYELWIIFVITCLTQFEIILAAIL